MAQPRGNVPAPGAGCASGAGRVPLASAPVYFTPSYFTSTKSPAALTAGVVVVPAKE
jgi:hypothetical protein